MAHPLSSADIRVFHWKSATFVTSRNTDIDCIASNSFNFFESLKVVLINMVAILMMSLKSLTLDLLKIKVI